MTNVKIIATCTDEHWGYRKGDVLEISEHAVQHGGIVTARNLTAPERYGRSYALLHPREFKLAKVTPYLVAEYRLFGIPILRKYAREAAE